MCDSSSALTAEQQVVLTLTEAFGRAIAAQPSLARARRVLRALRTGQHEIDRQVREHAEVIFRLAIAKCYLLPGHPAQERFSGTLN